jgi:N-methylhydantoinase B/oxoprolinase/acetone carboxylase alpha subunit
MTMVDDVNSAKPVLIDGIDPVTFEVIRHRLWAINDDQAMMAARLSGSPVVYEALDFNAAILTPDGRGIYAGIYILHHATSLDVFVQKIIEQWAPEEIRDGDLFFSNDPWSGALHANDGILAAPIFAQGELIAWSGIVMHDNDVGSSAPGSFVVGARERFAEAPLFPPIKIAENFELRPDLEAAYLYNHRTPELNALNLRARLASLRVTRDRLQDLVEQYGLAAFRAARDGVIDYTEAIARRRLLEIPDGTWFDQVYLDHDGNDNEIYPICCRLIKRADQLIVDFDGTAAEAPGAINCAAPAMEAAVIGVFFVLICHDLPWSVGAARRMVKIISEPGTVNNASPNAGVSMASIQATISTQDAVSVAMGKMLLASPSLHDESQACWASGHNLLVFAGIDRFGERFALPLLDACGGGGGARTFGDGIDSGGILHSMSATIPNVETTESRAPVLQLYRRQSRDSGGPGRFRGGVGIEFAIVPHRASQPLIDIAVASGVSQPEGHGLCGAGPAAVKSNVIFRDTDIWERFAAGKMPVTDAEFTFQSRELMEAKEHTELRHSDVHVSVAPGGGGYGDPLRRDADAVVRDLRAGLISTTIAESIYGVVLCGNAMDAVATESRREQLRRERMAASRPVSGEIRVEPITDYELLFATGDTLDAVSVNGSKLIRCNVCGQKLSAYDEDPRSGSVVRELPIYAVSPQNHLGDEERFILREYSCPACGTAIGMDVQLTSEPLLPDGHFA